MSNWRAFPEKQWTLVGKALSGYGGGEGAYGAAYAIDTDTGQFLNGRVSARIQLGGDHRVACAGVVARADELRSFVAFYVVTDDTMPDRFSVRLAAFKHGKLASLVGLKEPIEIPKRKLDIALQFFSGDVVGQVVTDIETHTLKRLFPMPAFPGWAGVVRFYGSSAISQNIQIEKITMKPILSETKQDGSGERYPFRVFLSHSSADKGAVIKVLETFKNSKIPYWIDHEQIKFGDGIVGKIEEGLRSSRYVVVCLSKNLASSGWCRAEYSPILYREFSGNTARRVIPLSLDGSSDSDAVPLLLSDKMRADVTNPTSFAAFMKFLREIESG